MAAATHRCQIWVAAGTYVPGATRDSSFMLAAGVSLYGGFAGTESSLAGRDIVTNETILSGEIGDVDLQTDNVYHVVTAAAGARLDGFTITAGYADGADFNDDSGAGVVASDVEMTIANCLFRGNYADRGGAGVTLDYSTSTVESCRFQDNVTGDPSAISGGGGRGAAIQAWGSSALITDCHFENNTATEFGGAISAFVPGGMIIRRSTFVGNDAGQLGGAIADDQADLTIVSCTFEGNSGDGAALVLLGSQGTVTNCLFIGNEGTPSAIYTQDEFPEIHACTFDGNLGYWGTISQASGALLISNSLFWNNRHPDGSWLDPLDVQETAVVENNCIEGLSSSMLYYADNSSCDPMLTADHRIGASSTCINGGNSTTLPADAADLDDDGDLSEPLPLDLSGADRVIGSNVDFGAFER